MMLCKWSDTKGTDRRASFICSLLLLPTHPPTKHLLNNHLSAWHHWGKKGIQKDNHQGFDETLRTAFWKGERKTKGAIRTAEELKRGRTMKNTVGESFRQSRFFQITSSV